MKRQKWNLSFGMHCFYAKEEQLEQLSGTGRSQ